MITRAQAAKMIRHQLNRNYAPQCISSYGETKGTVIPKPHHHIGKVEIRALLDAIYGLPDPTNIEEHVI